MFSGLFSSVAIGRQERKRDGIVSCARAYVIVCVSGRVERGGSAIIMLIARIPYMYIPSIPTFSWGGGIPLDIPNFLQSCFETERAGYQGMSGISL